MGDITYTLTHTGCSTSVYHISLIMARCGLNLVGKQWMHTEYHNSLQTKLLGLKGLVI